MSQTRLGYLYGLLAYLCWGLFPLYWRLLRPSGPLELLAHRIVWSLVCVLAVVAATRTWRRVRTLLRPRMLGTIALGAVLIAVNWGTYIYGVNAERVVETSLGYFINPLVTVLLGVLVLRERLTPAQWAAIGIGAVAVVVLTVDYGRPPWIALVLAVSFGLYGLIKKLLAGQARKLRVSGPAAMGGEGGLPAADGLAIESAVLAVPAAGYLVALGLHGGSTVGHVSPGHTALTVASGVVTAVPLLAFAGAANRIPLSGIGLMQYLAPVLQLACGVLILHEPLPPARLAGFALVWLALAVFTWDALRRLRSATRSRIGNAIPPAPVAEVTPGR